MNLMEIAKKGMYFCPAYKHYGQMTNVVCDRCNKTNLKACIGYNDKDLCLKCADSLTNMLINDSDNYKQVSIVRDFPVLTKMEQHKFVPLHTTMMMQNMMTKSSVKKNQNDETINKDIYEPHNVVRRVKKHVITDDVNTIDNEMRTYMMQDMFYN